MAPSDLPNRGRAVVDGTKLRDYLLSSTHPVGSSKAAFFARLGYQRHAWRVLGVDLREQHLLSAPAERLETAHGVKYIIRASLKGPSGVSAVVVSVWIVLATEDFPRFVTAYPGDQS